LNSPATTSLRGSAKKSTLSSSMKSPGCYKRPIRRSRQPLSNT
jgi:hypothetical protein